MAASMNQVPDTLHLLYVKEHVGVKWKDLARRLGFAEYTIGVFEAKHRDPRESCMEMLTSWQQRTGLEGTIEVLKEALVNAELKGIADHLEGEVFSGDNQLTPASAAFNLSRWNFVGNGLTSDKKLRTLFVRISKKIGSDWKDLVRVLGL
ncbi:tumor necrosis factor receptor superfamily member 1A-like [Branchiostoma lanceolatum]|uniref:tumor necrosis factor receptor superfamily member 1A-like n=1 Tax=Branchiostoma lanceolatum TaxID=7740 RepID=UPI0034534341